MLHCDNCTVTVERKEGRKKENTALYDVVTDSPPRQSYFGGSLCGMLRDSPKLGLPLWYLASTKKPVASAELCSVSLFSYLCYNI